MSPIARLKFHDRPVDAHLWPAIAAAVQAWLVARGAPPRDAVLLVPQAAQLAPARQAFAQAGGWQPRIETRHTLTASLGPPAAASAGQVSLDLQTDLLSADALLREQASGAAWARRDPRGFVAATATMVATTHALLQGAHAIAPLARAAYWQVWREAMLPLSGPGASERWLARIAVEWASAADPPGSDRLWTIQASAWLALRADSVDRLAAGLLDQAQADGKPALWVETVEPGASPFDAAARLPAPRRLRCADFEEEALAAAQAVLEALDEGQSPVALIAQDRRLVRRIRALLERASVALRDETGWTLSTTRAAARLMGLLRAAAPQASRDAVLDWWKSDGEVAPALQSLETSWRRDRPPDAEALTAWQSLLQRLQPLRATGSQSLTGWLDLLRATAADTLHSLAEDAAGRQVLAALRLDDLRPSPAWQAAAARRRLDLAGFTDWVDATLESASYVPPAGARTDVIVTPLAQALLRPFAAVVFPGCDEQQLGVQAIAESLLPDGLLREFGMPDANARRERERDALALLLRHPHLSLLRRRSNEGEPLAASPLLEQAWQARRRLRQDAPAESDASLPQRECQRVPITRPAPSAAQALPTRLSASTVEALRSCPYRFFARSVLGLRESSELDAELEKRDYGNWLHAVLMRFHTGRAAGAEPGDDLAALHAAADAEQEALMLDAAQMLPFRAAFAGFAAQYLAWLRQRDGQGWQFTAGELDRRIEPAELGGVALEGRIDRVDSGTADGLRQVIDYKTGSAQALKEKLQQPLEDTQLAFYAALLGSATPLKAIYLALDDRKPPQEFEHADVGISAAQLVSGLAQDLARLREGAGMPALGEGAVCDHCDVRGLCRRDHWQPLP